MYWSSGNTATTYQSILEITGNLQCTEKVPMFDERVIIPEALREQVLSILHSAHQGVMSMRLRAGQAVFWPNITEDLKKVRNDCNTCNRIALSQSNLPPVDRAGKRVVLPEGNSQNHSWQKDFGNSIALVLFFTSFV